MTHILRIHAYDTRSMPKQVGRVSYTDKVLSFHCCVIVNYSMEQSPSLETNRYLASQEISRITGNPKFYYYVYKCPPTVPILSQFNPIHVPTFHFLKINLIVIIPSKPGSSKQPLSHIFPYQTLKSPLLSRYVLHTPPIPFVSISSPEYYLVRIQNVKLLITYHYLFSPLPCYLVPPKPKYFPQILFSYNFSLCCEVFRINIVNSFIACKLDNVIQRNFSIEAGYFFCSADLLTAKEWRRTNHVSR